MQPKLVLFTVVGVSFSEPRVAFDVVVPRDDSTLFTGYLGVLPGVTGANNHDETYDRVGDSRTVHLSDGGTFREEIVRYARPAAPDAQPFATANDPAKGSATIADLMATGAVTQTPAATGHFDYDVTQFTGILGRIVSDATARWTYAPGTPGRTRITWTYGYRPLPGRTFLVRHIIGPLWMRYMRRSMGNALAAIVVGRQPASQPTSPPAGGRSA
ncbi:hypothetical protein [Subtercola lobariae]|uniref:SRPBCC family protein n=1 Tax=Subtercola lobariae TaxID=1588641 RepID=A0A917BCV9_9MICO|nr:hypothetical protein [Subtercola lobariae]GGF37283.1 hypothetical protein GCM10011399_32780 [Subtercola lobariae]